MKLTLTKETLVELTADDMAAVVGGGESDSCSIASCITSGGALRNVVVTVNVDICD